MTEKIVRGGVRVPSCDLSDDHAGLKAARVAVFPAMAWQRCPFHLQHNAGAYAPNKALNKPVAADIRAVFDAPDEAEAKRLIERFIRTCEAKAPQLAEWTETALPEGWAVLFSNKTSCIRRVTAVAMAISQDGQTGRRYLNMNEDESE